MKRCTHCAEEIQDEAKICRFCNRPMLAIVPANQSRSNAKLVGLLLVLAVLASIVLSQLDLPTRSRELSTPDVGEEVELLASRGSQSSDAYKRVDGQVRNLTEQAMRNLTAVVSWYDKDDRFISSDSALVEYRPLLPGQVSPFSVLVASNPEMKLFRVEFTVGGRPLSVKRSDLK